MFLEFMDGGALTDLITIDNPASYGYNENVIVHILREVAKGVDFLHQNNIIHRDIKSDNILLMRDTPDVKICDFGYAC